MDLTPEEGLHVDVAQAGEAGEKECLLNDVAAAWGIDQDFQFLNGKKLPSGGFDLRLLLGFQGLEWITRDQALHDGFVHGRGDTGHQQPGSGFAYRFLSPVGLAGPEERDETPAELSVHLRKAQILLPDGSQVFLDPYLGVPFAHHT